jgi:hypothetical protein
MIAKDDVKGWQAIAECYVVHAMLRSPHPMSTPFSQLAACLIALVAGSAAATGAELFYMDHDAFTEKFVGPVGPLVLSGEIEKGDYDRLLSKILDDQNRFLSQNKLLLASDGGDVAEAMKIGKLLRSLYSEIIVGPQTGRCVSACFLIYAAAQQRGTEGERLLGINRPFIADASSPTAASPIAASPIAADAAVAETNGLAQVRVYLQENDVPGYLIEEMFRHASDDAYWLSADDEKNLGSRSRSLTQYLIAKCAWDDALEREVYAGKRPMDDLAKMWKCRASITLPDAQKALASASKERAARDKKSATGH